MAWQGGTQDKTEDMDPRWTTRLLKWRPLGQSYASQRHRQTVAQMGDEMCNIAGNGEHDLDQELWHYLEHGFVTRAYVGRGIG